ncbi:MAG: helix-turn-helix domain-containing protein [Coriobacteriales bacterium]|nr:helix-turn-helix domain-containing protein [Coriobacteriales bacterium]
MSPLVLLPVFIMTVLIIESCRLFRFMNVPSFDKHALSTSPLGLVVIPFCAGELFFRFATRIVPRIFSADKLMVYTAFILHHAALATFIVMCACVAQYVYRAKVLTSRTSQGLEQPDLFNHDTKISKPITLEMLNNALPQNIINELKEYGLSQNEIDSVKAEAAGLTSQELAELKGIKASTAREYASRAKRKLNMSLSEAITLFKRDKHIEIHPDDTANITNAQETQVVNKQTFHINTLLWFIAFVLLATLGCTLLLPFGDVAGNKVFVWTHIYGTAGGLLALHGMAWYKSRIITISDKYYLQYSVAFLVLLLMSALCLIWVRIHSYEYLPAIGGGLHKASVIIATSFFVVSLGGLLAILFNQRNVKNGAFQDKAMLYCSLGSVLFISINCIIMSILPTGLSKTIIVVVLTIITVITIGFAIVLIPKDQRPLHFINRGSMLFEGNVATLLAATFVCLLVSYAYEELWRSQSQISLVNSCLPAIGLICCLPMYYIFHVYQQKLYAGVSIAACLLSSVVIGILGQSIAWVMIYCFVLLIIQLAVIFIADGSSNALSEKLNIYLLNSKPPAHNNDQNTDTCSLPVTWHNPYLVCAGALLGSMLIVNACVTLATTSAGRIMIGSTDRAALLNVIIMLLITLVFAVFIVSVIAYEHKKGLLISSFESTSFTERAEGYLKFCGLNDRQVQIALLTAKGMNVKQIAAEIGYSSSTIASERTLIYSCLNVVSSKQLLSLLLKSVRG